MKFLSNYLTLGALLMGVGILVGCGSENSPSHDEFGDQPTFDNESEGQSRWNVSVETDPFSDQQIQTASTRFSGEKVDVDVQISCTGSQLLGYRFTTFRKNGSPSRMSKLPSSLEMAHGSNPIERIDYIYRIDNQPSKRAFSIIPKQDNSLYIRSSNSKFRTAKTLTVGLPTDGGRQAVVIDQTAEPIRKLVESCFDSNEVSDFESPDPTEDEENKEDNNIGSVDSVDFGGAEVGMMYSVFRDRLVDAGFNPEPVDRTELCQSDPQNFQCLYKFPETDYCSGTGEGYCSYLWSKGSDEFTVTTREHEAGEVVGMRFNR